MPRLDGRRFDNPEYNVVLGPCPGCDDWQVDYTNEVADSYEVPMSFAPGAYDPEAMTFTIQPFRDVIEHVLQEHLRECPRLQDLVSQM